MSLADEGQEVVFAQEYSSMSRTMTISSLSEANSAVDDFLQGLAIAVAEVLHGLGRALRGVEQASRCGSSPRPTRISR